jgi:hypothetical protein
MSSTVRHTASRASRAALMPCLCLLAAIRDADPGMQLQVPCVFPGLPCGPIAMTVTAPISINAAR